MTSTATVTGACTIKFVSFEWAVTHTFRERSRVRADVPGGRRVRAARPPLDQFAVTGAFNLVEHFTGESTEMPAPGRCR